MQGTKRSPALTARGSSRAALRPLWLVLVMALAVSCATARVQKVEHAPPAIVLPRPGRVVVFDFETGGSDVRVASSSLKGKRRVAGLSVTDADLLAEAVADALATRLVDDVNALGLVAERAIGTAPPALNDVVVQGQFLRIDEGSAVKRFVIGFGAGATELRTQVEMFQVNADGWRPIMKLETVAEGARFPGAGFAVAGAAAVGTVATSAVVSSGAGVGRELRVSIDADARRTSEQIAKKVWELKFLQRW